MWKKDNVEKFFMVINNQLFMKKTRKCPICAIGEKFHCDCQCHDEKVKE